MATVPIASVSGKTFPLRKASFAIIRPAWAKPFLHEAYLSELTALRDQLKAGLSHAAHQSGNDEGPSTSELAEKIKAIKAANSIEATPQRVRQKQYTAEEPVTARIRRKQEAETPSTPEESTGKSLSFQERIAMERRKDQGHELS